MDDKRLNTAIKLKRRIEQLEQLIKYLEAEEPSVDRITNLLTGVKTSNIDVDRSELAVALTSFLKRVSKYELDVVKLTYKDL